LKNAVGFNPPDTNASNNTHPLNPTGNSLDNPFYINNMTRLEVKQFVLCLK